MEKTVVMHSDCICAGGNNTTSVTHSITASSDGYFSEGSLGRVSENIPTEKEIDKLIENSYMEESIVKKLTAGMSEEQRRQFNVCRTYNSGGKQVLQVVKGMLFIKPKWAAIVSALIMALDGLCPPNAKPKKKE